MRKIFKIVLAVFAILIIIAVSFAAVLFLDLVAYTAQGSQTLSPRGTSVGTALVVYDPGLSGNAEGVAEKVADDLQAQNYTVTLAGVKSSTSGHTAGYSVIVVGGPVYAGALTSSIKDFVSHLSADSGAKVGIFGSGQGATSTEDIAQIK
jgi:flavodoxin